MEGGLGGLVQDEAQLGVTTGPRLLHHLDRHPVDAEDRRHLGEHAGLIGDHHGQVELRREFVDRTQPRFFGDRQPGRSTVGHVDGGVDEIISTRRLVHIIKAFGIFNDRMTAIEMCTNRFDDETKHAFLDLYTKVDEGVIKSEENSEESVDF